MIESILESTKHSLNLAADYTPFDAAIIMHINSVFSTLNQLGVGPDAGFMYLRVRMLFDPPTIGYLVEAMKEQIKELEWRINAQRESVAWTEPEPVIVVVEE